MHEDSLLDYAVAMLGRQNAIPIADGSQRRELAKACSCLSALGGTDIFVEGSQSDSIYLIVTGMLGLFTAGPNGQPALARRMGAGEVVGEIGFLTGEPRSGTVRALRNSELLHISREALEETLSRRPEILRSLCGAAVRRLLSNERSSIASSPARTISLVPINPTIDIGGPVEGMARALAAFGKVAIGACEHDRDWSAGRLSDIEKSHDFLLLTTNPKDAAWTQFCLRQCDRLLLLANGDDEPESPAALGANRSVIPENLPRDLVLQWRGRVDTTLTSRWLSLIRPSAHYHARSSSDIARVARLVFGRGTTLVLSGGGARGLAHVGAIRALLEQGIEIDAIGGTSIGAVIGAMYSLGWNLDDAARSCVDAFSRNRLTDFAFPRTALFSGRKFERTFGAWFGSLNIEDAPIPFFCVSTNLSRGKAEAHRSGSLAKWLQASTAIPGVFPPVVDGGAVHVDGGVLDNLPVDAARGFCAGKIIGVDAGSEAGVDFEKGGDRSPSGRAELPKLSDLLWQVATIGNSAAYSDGPPQCDVVVRPALADIKLLAWRLREHAVDAGYRAVMEHISAIRSAVRHTDSNA
jgi:NTE family protein